VIRWDQGATIDSERCPRIHRNDNVSHRGGGSLSFVTGDLMNADLCRGPFDVVVERRTVQLFPEPERIGALQQLVTRLGRRGVFVSQQHFGWWKAGQPINH
jgi:hypothetical protein